MVPWQKQGIDLVIQKAAPGCSFLSSLQSLNSAFKKMYLLAKGTE